VAERIYLPVMENITQVSEQRAAIVYRELLKENGRDDLRMVNMEILKIREMASVKTLDIEISEDELDVYEKCLNYVLQRCSSNDIEQVSGATPEELEAIWQQIHYVLRKYTDLREMAST